MSIRRQDIRVILKPSTDLESTSRFHRKHLTIPMREKRVFGRSRVFRHPPIFAFITTSRTAPATDQEEQLRARADRTPQETGGGYLLFPFLATTFALKFGICANYKSWNWIATNAV